MELKSTNLTIKKHNGLYTTNVYGFIYHTNYILTTTFYSRSSNNGSGILISIFSLYINALNYLIVRYVCFILWNDWKIICQF